LRYLITGGAGLLVHTCRAGFSIAATTWFCSTTSRPAGSKTSPSQVLRPHAISPGQHENRQLLASSFDDADVIVHLARRCGVKSHRESPSGPSRPRKRHAIILEQPLRRGKLFSRLTSEIYARTQCSFPRRCGPGPSPTTKAAGVTRPLRRSMSFSVSYWKEKSSCHRARCSILCPANRATDGAA